MTKREAQYIMNGMFTYLKRIGDVTFDVSLLGTDIEHFPGSFEKQGVNTIKYMPILPMFKNLFLEIIYPHLIELNKKVDNAWGDFHFVQFYIQPDKKVIEMEHFIEQVEYSNQTPKRFTESGIITEVIVLLRNALATIATTLYDIPLASIAKVGITKSPVTPVVTATVA